MLRPPLPVSMYLKNPLLKDLKNLVGRKNRENQTSPHRRKMKEMSNVQRPGIVDEILPLQEIKKRTWSTPPPPQLPPLQVAMQIRRNDLNQEEKSYIRSLVDSRGGHCKYDHVDTRAKFIHRCSLVGCINPYNSRGDLAINSNGIKKHFQCHVLRGRPGMNWEFSHLN